MSDNKNMKEKISALADGELSDFETRRILTEISSNLNIEISGAVFSKPNFHLKNRNQNFWIQIYLNNSI